MKEPGRGRGRERVKTAGAGQVSKLRSFACNQRSGRGSLREWKPSPGIATLLASPPEGRGTGHPPPTPGDTHGIPHATHAPALGCPALWGALEDTRMFVCPCTDPNSWPVLPGTLGRFPGKQGCTSALGEAPHQGGVALGSPTALPALFFPQFLWFFPILL